MALKFENVNFEMNNTGIIINNPYIKINSKNTRGNRCNFGINVYNSKECRDADKCNLSGRINGLEDSYSCEIDIEQAEYIQCYNYLKSLDEFQGAQDC